MEIFDAQQLQHRERPPRQRPQDVRLLGDVDVQTVFFQSADLEGDLLDLMQRLSCETAAVPSLIEDRRPSSASLALSQRAAISSPAWDASELAQYRRSGGEGGAVHGLPSWGSISQERCR